MAGGYNLATYAVSPISPSSAHWAGGLFYGSFILELLDELFVTHIGTQSSVLCSLRGTRFVCQYLWIGSWITLSYFITTFGCADACKISYMCWVSILAEVIVDKHCSRHSACSISRLIVSCLGIGLQLVKSIRSSLCHWTIVEFVAWQPNIWTGIAQNGMVEVIMNVAVVARGNMWQWLLGAMWQWFLGVTSTVIFLDRTAFTLQVRVAPSGDCNHYLTGASQCKAGWLLCVLACMGVDCSVPGVCVVCCMLSVTR